MDLTHEEDSESDSDHSEPESNGDDNKCADSEKEEESSDTDDEIGEIEPERDPEYPEDEIHTNYEYMRPTTEWPLLTYKMEKEIHETISERDDYLLPNGALKVKDLHNFKEGEWLEDQVIDYYMTLIIERNKDQKLPTVYAFAASYVKLILYSKYEDICEPDDEENDDNIFAYSLIVFPLHVHKHWRLVVVDVLGKSISMYDSTGCKDTKNLKLIVHFLVKDYIRLYKARRSNETKMDHPTNYFNGWSEGHQKNLPQQDNDSDCGIFILQFANHVTANMDIVFSQSNVPYFRTLMTYETIEGSI